MAKRVIVSWTDPADTTNVDHLEVWRKTGSGGTYAQIGTDLALGVETYNDTNSGTGLTDGVQYYYDVRVYNASDSYVSTESNITISSGDTTAPTLISPTIENAAPTNVVMVFSEAVTMTNLVSNGFTLSGTTSTSFSSISGSGTTWTGVLGTAAANGETITLSYSSSTGDVEDTSANPLATFSGTSVTNNISGSSIIISSYDFAGTTPDPAKATITNPNSTLVTITQNNTFIGTSLASGVSGFGQDYMRLLPDYDFTTERWYSFDIQVPAQDHNTWGVYIANTLTSVSTRLQIGGIATNATSIYVGLASALQTVALDVSTTKTIKIRVNSTTAYFYYWNGSSWVQLGTSVTHGMSGTLQIGCFYRSVAPYVSGDTFIVDNYYVSSADFSTQYPT